MGRLIIAGLAGLVLAAAPAMAAPAKDATPKKASTPAASAAPGGKGLSAAALTETATKGAKKKPRVIDFEDETIRGTLTKPEGDIIGSRRRGKQRSLIKLRRHWVPELLKSADDL